MFPIPRSVHTFPEMALSLKHIEESHAVFQYRSSGTRLCDLIALDELL